MFVDPEGLAAVAIPIGYVLWGGAYISAQTCALIPACKKRWGDILMNVADGAGDVIDDVIDYCTGNDSNMSCETRYEQDMNYCDIKTEEVTFVLGKKEGFAYYSSCKVIAGDRLSNCKKGIMDTPEMPPGVFD